MNINLTDAEAGFLYAMLHRHTQETSHRRRRRVKISEAEQQAQKIALSLRAKVRASLPKGAAQVIEITNAGLMY